MKKIFILIAAAVVTAAALPAAQGDYGTEALFSVGAGARSVGMGGAFTALSDDASGAAHNPAGAAFLSRQHALFMHYPLYENTLFNSLTYGIPILDFGTIGISAYRISSGGIEGFDSFDASTGTFEYMEYKGSLFYAKPINESLAAGARLNVYGINVLNVNSAGFGADAGIMYKPAGFLSLGVVLENIVKPFLSLSDESEDLPQRYIGGAALTLEAGGFGFILSGDAILGEREQFKYRAGAEIKWSDIIALRAGLDDGQLAFGGGLSVAGIGVNYAYVVNEYFSGLSVMDVSYSFGMTIEEQKREKAKEIRKQVKELVDRKISGEMELKADVFYEKGYALFDSAKYEEALAELQKALEWYPKHWKAKRLRSWINYRIKELYFEAAYGYYRQGDYLKAIENFTILQKYADNYRNMMAYKDRIYSKLDISGSAKAYFASGVAFYVKKDYNKADEQWQKALSSNPGNPAIKQYINKAKGSSGVKAKSKRKEVSEEDRRKSEEIYYKAVDAYTSGETDRAMRLWEESIRINPENISALRDREKAKIEIEELRRRGIR